MAAINRWARAVAACSLCACWTLACCGEAAMAQGPAGGAVVNGGLRFQGPIPGSVITGQGAIPCKDPCLCVPNARTFGYFNTQWRQWPAEARPDRIFPASINKEELPPPPGQEPIPVPRGTLTPPGGALDALPGVKDFGPGMGGIKIDSRLPGGGLGGLEEPSEQPKTPLKPSGIEGGLPPLTPGTLEKPKNGAKDTPTFEPPTAPKTNEEGSNRRPRGVRPSDPLRQPFSPQGEETKVRADWTRVLEPGFRGDVERPRLTEAAPARPQMNPAPVRQATHQAFDMPGRSAVQRPVFEQPADQPNRVAPASWQGENRPAMLDGYCPVDLGKNERWTKGDPRFSESYQGMTFCFSNAMQRECFLVDPERYVPAYSGSDAVLLIEGNRMVPGKVDFCVTYDGRVYMFSSAESLAKFRQEPKRYTLTGR